MFIRNELEAPFYANEAGNIQLPTFGGRASLALKSVCEVGEAETSWESEIAEEQRLEYCGKAMRECAEDLEFTANGALEALSPEFVWESGIVHLGAEEGWKVGVG